MASTTSRTKPPLTFAISYGLAGGPAHARKLRQLLQAAGFKHAPLSLADIIIARSGGTWLIPSDLNPKLVVYVGIPFDTANPRRTWRAARSAMRRHGKLINMPSTWAKNTFYMILQPRRNFRMVRMARQAQPITFPGVETVFIGNRHDPWPGDVSFLQNFAKNSDWSFLSLPGAHDDIWEHPERYAKIVEYYARLLG